MQPQRTLLGLVVDELTLPGEKSLVLKTFDRLARTETHIAGKNIHQFVLRVSCSTGLGRVLADFGRVTTNRGARREPGIHASDGGGGFRARGFTPPGGR
jgi:hypothetical protein